MANETVFTGLAHPTDVFSDAVSAALIENVVVMPLIFAEDLPVNTTIKYFKKDGYLTSSASAVSEGANYTTLSQYTIDKIAVTTIKDVCASWKSVEAEQFGGVSDDLLAKKQGEALARRLDDEIIALFSGFSQGVTATAKLTIDDILDAAYTVRKNLSGAAGRALTAVLDWKGAHELRKEIVKSAASVYTIPAMVSLLGTPGQSLVTNNGFVGNLPGLEIFETTGCPTGGGDNTQAVFDRSMAFCGVYGRAVETIIVPRGIGNPSVGKEVLSYIFHGVAEWNDYAGCMLKSDT